MRLIDADALEESFEGEEMMLSDAILVHSKISAAPTVKVGPMSEHEVKFYDKFVEFLIQQDKENGR